MLLVTSGNHGYATRKTPERVSELNGIERLSAFDRVSPLLRLSLQILALHHHTNIIRIYQIGYRPAIQVILGHALFGEALIPCGLSYRISHHQNFETNAF